MSTTIGVGFSQILDPQQAALQACVQAKAVLNSAQTDLVIVFACPDYIAPEILGIIARSLRPKRLVGSSTGAIILPQAVVQRGIALVGINSDEMIFGISAIPNITNQDMRYVGFELAQKSSNDLGLPQREAFISFSGGIEKGNTRFIQGIKEVLGHSFPIIGAISSDDCKYRRLHQFFQDQILENASVGLLLGGRSFSIGLGCWHGFKPIGKPRTITQVDGHVIRGIDHKPAIDIYKHFLGDKADLLKNAGLGSLVARYPLGIVMEDRQYLLRNIIDILPDGSIVCQGGIPAEAQVHLMISNKDFCHQSAVDAAECVKTTLSGKQAKLILIFESWSRHKILGRSMDREIEAIKGVLGYKTPVIGMSSFGEVAPFGSLNNIKNIYLQNGSILIAAIA